MAAQSSSSRLRSVRRLVVLIAALLLSVTAVVAAGGPSTAAASRGSAGSATGCIAPVRTSTRVGAILGIVRPMTTGPVCTKHTGDPAGGTPPLLNHGGPVMSVPSVNNKVVITPIYWAPSGYSFTASYENVINKFLADSAAASGRTDNVFSTMTEYSGSNGAITYGMQMGTPVIDTTAYPTAGCTVNGGSVYGDGSGYTTCLDDDQVIAEANSVVTSHGFTRDYGHMYVMFLPKHVESCFLPGNPSGQQCTINSSPSAAYCAYHSAFNSGGETVYANMPFPIYNSSTGYSCTDESLGGGIQAPNGDPDADVEVSPTSHEIAEAITDPDGNAWYDSTGYENGDECAYTYGTLSGAAGAHYNQTLNGDHFLAQEEFSNQDFVATGGGCLQHAYGATPTPTVTAVNPASGTTAGGTSVTLTGANFTGVTGVSFGTTNATSYTVASSTSITAVSPAHSAGAVDVRVTTSGGGTSATGSTDTFTFQTPVVAPAVSGISPKSGPASGGTTVTITGSHFTGATSVKFGTTTATHFTVVSGSKITAVSPHHAAGKIDIRVSNSAGASPSVAADKFTFVAAPAITKVSPVKGTHNGGTRVTITGSRFTGATAVKFGATRGTRVTVVSATKITVTSPRHAKGRVDVRVTTVGGTSPAVTADHYTFT